MITIQKMSEAEVNQQQKKERTKSLRAYFWMLISTILLGLLFMKIIAMVITVFVISGIFFYVAYFSPPPINTTIKIIRRNKVVDVRRNVSVGRATKKTLIYVTLAKEEIPAGYIQTDSFMLYHSFGHFPGPDEANSHNYQFLKGKEIEIEYMANNGFITAFKVIG